MVNSGTIIWISIVPLIRLTFCVAMGFSLARLDIFPQVASRGTGQMIINVALPCLLFSKIVPGFSLDNIQALGPLVVISILYQLIGLGMAWVARYFFWVPHRFRYGILVAGCWPNYSDIPTSVLISLTSGSPFNGSADETKAIAYVALFIFVYMTTFFPCGGYLWLAKDWDGPEMERDEIQAQVQRNRHRITSGWIRWLDGLLSTGKLRTQVDLEKQSPSALPELENVNSVQLSNNIELGQDGSPTDRHETVVSDGIDTGIDVGSPSTTIVDRVRICSTSIIQEREKESSHIPKISTTRDESADQNRFLRRRITRRFTSIMKSLFTPASFAVIVSFPIALVPTLKALFVAVDNVHIAPAPDGTPPLGFIIDTASFVGAASPPVGLIILGTALGRIKLPGRHWDDWNNLPLGAISTLAIGKMLICPVLGVLIVHGLTNVGFIQKDDKVLQFVCIFFSCLPTATTPVYVTQIYSPTGSADDIPPFLVPQYVIMFVSMTALTAFTLNYLF